MLNHEQEKVVDSSDPFIFLLAGAGSGKTRVIIEKIKRLINDGVEPSQILAITFTRKASHEMKERLGLDDVSIHTFHQLAYIILKDQLNMQFEVVNDKVLKHYTEDHVLAVSNYKNSLFKTRKPRIYKQYQEDIMRQGLFDFDDLLIELLNVLSRQKDLIAYRYICVDEFQDTNLLQYQILKKLIGKTTRVLAVGDPDQAIYQFRGASPKIIDLYIKEYNAAVYQLTYNYRSDSSIINAANRLIKQNNRSYKKELVSTKHDDGITRSIMFEHDEKEASWIYETIIYYKNQGISLNEMAVLYRNHFRAYPLILKLHEMDLEFSLHDDSMSSNIGIQLMTIHQAKGLEFDLVFIMGCENEILPSQKTNTHDSREEERRLMFVGMTRSRHFLFLTHSQFNGENHHFTSSIFLRESGVKTIPDCPISDIISLGDYRGNRKTHQRIGQNHQSSKR